MVAFPTGLDNFTNPSGGNTQDSPDHATQHANANDAIEALEAKVGIDGSAVSTSLDFKVGLPKNLTGAVAATRYVGGRASTVPTGGTFAVGDFVILQTGDVGICTVAGSPGTWTTVKATSFSQTTPDYVIYKSGSNYLARNTSTNVDDYSSTNAASVVQSAHDALGRPGLIELKRGVTYTATSMVTLSQAGVLVWSSAQLGEDQSTFWQVTSTLSADQAAFRLTGSGAAIGGINVDGNGKADYCIDLRAGGQMAYELGVRGSNVANLYLNGPAGAARCNIWNIRSDNGTGSGSMNFKFDGPDHMATGLRSSGTAANGYSLWMDTSRMQIADGHITGNGTEAACVQITGNENRLSTLYLDTGADGSAAGSVAGGAHTIVKGSGNYVEALIQNASCQAAVNVTAVAVQTGTVYRFTCTSSSTLAVGDAVWLEGFASSTGFFQNSANGDVLVSNISDGTHFDADLGASTTFTDQVGTFKKHTKYGLLLQKASAGVFCQGNEFHLNWVGKGANLNTAQFYYAVGVLDENGNDPSSFLRFTGNRIYGNAATTTRFSNLEATWGSTTHSEKLFVDVRHYTADTTTPQNWCTRTFGKTAASTASSWTITHGLAGLPSFVSAIPTVDPGSGVRWWISSVTSTQFVITSSASITSEAWYWKAEM